VVICVENVLDRRLDDVVKSEAIMMGQISLMMEDDTGYYENG
jgi:hypothetical protein